MDPVRPLRDLFGELAHRDGGGGEPVDPRATLHDAGHRDLPPDQVAEALVSYAASAPLEVAERLGPFVTAHSGVPPLDDDRGSDDGGGPVEPPSLADAFGLLIGAAEPVDESQAFDGGPLDLGPDNLALDGLALADVTPDLPMNDTVDDTTDQLADELADDDPAGDTRFGAGQASAEPVDDAAETETGWGTDLAAAPDGSIGPDTAIDDVTVRWAADPATDLDLADLDLADLDVADDPSTDDPGADAGSLDD